MVLGIFVGIIISDHNNKSGGWQYMRVQDNLATGYREDLIREVDLFCKDINNDGIYTLWNENECMNLYNESADIRLILGFYKNDVARLDKIIIMNNCRFSVD